MYQTRATATSWVQVAAAQPLKTQAMAAGDGGVDGVVRRGKNASMGGISLFKKRMMIIIIRNITLFGTY